MVDIARALAGAKKDETMPVWRCALALALALIARCKRDKITYSEGLRRAVAFWLTGDEFYDFDAHPVHVASLCDDSRFDEQSVALHGDAKRRAKA